MKNNQEIIDLALKQQKEALKKIDMLKGIEGVDQSIVHSCNAAFRQLESGNIDVAEIMANNLKKRFSEIEKENKK